MAKKDIFQKDHLIDSHDEGIKLHLREKKPRGMQKSETANTLLMVHGQSTPAPVAFDLPLPGYSWMDFAADRGFHVYALCIRGYGPPRGPRKYSEAPQASPLPCGESPRCATSTPPCDSSASKTPSTS